MESCEATLTSPEGVLCIVCHGVCLVQNDQLESGAENGSSAGKTEDLATHDANASVVRGIQLQGVESWIIFRLFI